MAGDNSIVCQVNKPLVVSYNSVNDLSEGKIIYNAIELKVYKKDYDRNISAKISFDNVPQNEIPQGWILLRLSNRTSPGALINKYESPLTNTPTFLFTQPADRSNNEQYYSFYYDIVINPLTSFIKTGDLNYSIIFTTSGL